MKRAFFIFIAIFVSALSVYGIYTAFFRTPDSGTELESNTTDEFGTLFPAGSEREGSAPGGQTALNQGTGTSTPENIPAGQAVSGDKATLRKAVSSPIGGAQTITQTDGSHRLRYIEKATGHLYEIAPGETIPNRLSNTTIPKIQEVYWAGNGESAVVRSFVDKQNSVQNSLVTLKISTSTIGTTQTGELTSISLPRTISALVTSPDKQSVFYFNKVGDGVVGVTQNLKTRTQKQVLSHLFTDWNASWPETNTIALTTRPSATVPGSLFLLDIKTGTVSPLLSDVLGLTALISPDLKTVVYSESTKTGLLTEFMDAKTQAREFLPVGTLPEKCVWSTKASSIIYCGAPKSIGLGQYPDAWYQGSVSFADDLWKINLNTGDSTLLFETTQISEQGLDATKLFLSPDEKTLYFTDKKTSTLWELSIKGE